MEIWFEFFYFLYLVISLVAKDAKTGSSWKTNPEICKNETDQAFVKCIENETVFPLNETIVANLTKFNITPFFPIDLFGITHSIILENDAITFEPHDSLQLFLNESLEYMILFSDPNFQVFSPNPGTVPKTLLNLQQKSGMSLVYFKVTVTAKSRAFVL